tara:strand:+ start:41883 stop:42368 length:486 start_codon:yes stop_codon:yes gene_type:complete
MSLSKKIVLLGHFGVGKTSLVRRFVDSAFSEDYIVTMGVQVKKKEVEVGGQKIKLIIWDIEGNTSISKARKSYLIGSQGFIYVYDVTRPETFENLSSEKQYLNEIFPGVPVCSVGNKSDLIDSDQKENFIRNKIFENSIFTSAKTGENVERIFLEIAKNVI